MLLSLALKIIQTGLVFTTSSLISSPAPSARSRSVSCEDRNFSRALARACSSRTADSFWWRSGWAVCRCRVDAAIRLPAKEQTAPQAKHLVSAPLLICSKNSQTESLFWSTFLALCRLRDFLTRAPSSASAWAKPSAWNRCR